MENHNPIILELLALEKFKENLRLVERDRLVAKASRNSSEPIWRKMASWLAAGEPESRKPARA